MKDKAAEILRADPDALAWFRYGATYAMSLVFLADFYRAAGRDPEADDVMAELKQKAASADCPATIAKNLLRLGFFWDELEEVDAAKQPGVSNETMLDIVRKK